MDVWTDRHMDIQDFSPFYRTLSPVRATAQKLTSIWNKANRHKLRAPCKQRPTNQWTDGRTDKAAYRVACTRLKNRDPFAMVAT